MAPRTSAGKLLRATLGGEGGRRWEQISVLSFVDAFPMLMLVCFVYVPADAKGAERSRKLVPAQLMKPITL